MRRALILLLAAVMLLCFVACNNDPNIYKFESTSYLGNWEINIAPLEGDVDGCIQLLQYEFKSDFTYSVIKYQYNAPSKEVIVVEDFDEGIFEYVYDEDTGIGTLTLDGGPTEFYWIEGEGLSTLILGKQYNYKRPKYIIRKADNQKDVVGLWERRTDDYDLWGKQIRQLDIKSDGTIDVYEVSGVAEPDNLNETISWKYKELEVEKTYSRTYTVKWMYGSEIIVSPAPSSIGEDLHEEINKVTRYESLLINDNGVSSVVDIGTISVTYTIFQYGDRMLLKYGATTYEKVSNRIDLSEKYKEIVNVWDEALGGDLLYLRSDGTYSSEFMNLLNYSDVNDNGYYTGTYSAEYSEVATADVVAFDEARYKVENPGVEPVGGWDAWREAETAAIEALKVDNDLKLYIGKITFRPNFGFEETFDVFFRSLTPKYGHQNIAGEPVTDYVMVIRVEDNEGDITYYDFED